MKASGVLCFLALFLAGCTPVRPLPTLSPTVTLAHLNSSITPISTPTLTQIQVIPKNTPEPGSLGVTPSPVQPTPGDTEIAQTRTVLAELYVAQTQYAILSQPSLTLTPCLNPPCKSATPTWSLPSTKTPTLTPTATTRLSELHIITPGPLSRVISPIHLQASGRTGAAGMIRVELFDETGRLIMRQLLNYGTIPDAPFLLDLDIPFEIPVVSEAARLVVSTDDAKNRPVALTSADLILLSIGDALINPAGDNKAPIIIQAPAENTAITSGFMEVTGQVRAISDQPLLLEVITDEGALVGTRQASVVAPPDGAYHPFEAVVPYIISQTRNARLIVRQEGSHIPGNVALSSIVLTLKP